MHREKVNTKTSESPLPVGTKLQIKFVMLFTYSQIRWQHHLLYNVVFTKTVCTLLYCQIFPLKIDLIEQFAVVTSQSQILLYNSVSLAIPICQCNPIKITQISLTNASIIAQKSISLKEIKIVWRNHNPDFILTYIHIDGKKHQHLCILNLQILFFLIRWFWGLFECFLKLLCTILL